MNKTCGNCINCWKNDKFWSCENCEGSVGMPVKCNPPYDEACSNWSNRPEDRDKAANELRDFVDHYWEESDD